MKTAIISGATGLIGSALVRKLITSDQYRLVYLITRRATGITHPKIREIIIDFDDLNQLIFGETLDDAFCTLGTTMKQAGSREKFKKVDHDYVVAFARLCKQAGASKFLLISSMGANSKSVIFYNQIKGMTEQELIATGFKQLVILRPSLLLGERAEPRLAEKISGLFMKFFNFFIPDNYKAIKGEHVAESMLMLAQKPDGPVKIVSSGEILNGPDTSICRNKLKTC